MHSLAQGQEGGFRARFFAQSSITHSTFDILETTPGRYLGAGVYVDSNNVFLLAVVGLDELGNKLWERKLGRDSLTFANPLFAYRSMCKKGNHIYLGTTLRDSTLNFIGTLIKFDFDGNVVWQRYYQDSTAYLITNTASEAADGGFLLTGYASDTSPSSTRQAVFIVKTDSEGHEVWRKIIDKPTPNKAEGKKIIQEGSSRKIVVCGYEYVGPITVSNIRKQNIMVLDSTGNIISNSSYTSGELVDLIQTSDNSIVSVGFNERHGGIGFLHSPFAIKFNINFPDSPIWKIDSLDSTGEENLFISTFQLPNGDLIIAGSYDSLLYTKDQFNPLSRFVWVNPNGKIVKKAYYDYGSSDTNQLNLIRLRCVNPTSDGGWVTSIRCQNAGNNPMFFVKYDASGCDTTAEFCKTTDAAQQFVKLIQIGPNPFSDELSISSSETEIESISKIQLFDNTGCEISVRYFKNPSELKIKTPLLRNGVYILRVFVGNDVILKKVVKAE